MRLPKGLREFIESLNSAHVEYVVVGGFALAFHGFPRFTGDLDVLVRASADNAGRLEIALATFGFGSLGLKAADFLKPGQVIQLGLPPNRIDILTSITGVSFESGIGALNPNWMEYPCISSTGNHSSRTSGRPDGRRTGAGRAKDKADLEALGDGES